MTAPVFTARVPFTAPQIGAVYDPQQMRTVVNGIARAIPPMCTRTVTADTKISATDDTLLVDTTAGDVTVTLLPANQVQFLRVQIKNTGTNSVVMSGTVDGVANPSLTALATVVLQSDGVGWRRLHVSNDRVFNVFDYGSASTAATTSAAITAALAAASAVNGVVELPAGRYTLASHVVVPSNVTIRGAGGVSSVILCPSSDYGLYVLNQSNVIIEGLALSGAGIGIWIQGSSQVTVRANTVTGCITPIGGSYSGGIFAVTSDDVTIEGNTLSGNGNDPGAANRLSSDIQINGSGTNTGNERIRIIGNTCLSTLVQTNIIGYDIQYSEISGNVCSGAMTPTDSVTHIKDSGGYGIAIYRVVYTPDTTLLEDNRVTNNTVYAVEGTGIYLQHGKRLVCVGNTVKDCCTQQDATALAVGGVSVSDCIDSTISANTINNSTQAGIVISGSIVHDGIAVTGNQINGAGDYGVSLRGAITRSTVTGNAIKDTLGGIGMAATPNALLNVVIADNSIVDTRSTSKGIQLYGAGRTSVTGNVIERSGGAGIEIVDSVGAINVSMNTVLNGSVAASGTYSGINIASPRVTVVGNSVGNTGVTGYGTGIVLTSACTNGLAACNRVEGCLTANFSISTTASISQVGNQDGASPGSTSLGAFAQLNGAPSSVLRLRLGTSSNIGEVGTIFSSGNTYMAGNAVQDTSGNWSQSLSSANSMLFLQNTATEWEFYYAAAGTAGGNFATFWGTVQMAIKPTGLIQSHGLDSGTGDIKITGVGKGYYVKEGANATMGRSVLVAGTVTVANTKVTANSEIFLTTQIPGGTLGTPEIASRIAGTSFTITSSSALDTSTVAWIIFEPA